MLDRHTRRDLLKLTTASLAAMARPEAAQEQSSDVNGPRAIRRGGRRVESCGTLEGISHVAFANPDGSKVVVLTNWGAHRRLRLRISGREAEVNLPTHSISTLTWST